MPVPLQNESAAFRYADWLERACRGDRDAFARLYDSTYRRVFSYLLARVGERPPAEDLMQEVYLAALESISRFRGRTEAEFVGWLLKIARGTAADRLRSRYRRPEVTLETLPDGGDADPVDAIEQRLRLREVTEALKHLTQEQQDVIINRMVLGLDLEETSRVMGKSVGAIKALQHRGLAQLARILPKNEENP